ncbi:MAG: AI-2E family transporter, partial [Clostridia bacterium]|nr:AI-2E family transporter [Clostridia bacterium]
MNPDNKKEYRVKAVYAVVVLVVSAVIILGVINKMDFAKYAGILSPFLYGFVIAYILNYVVNFFKKILTGVLVRGRKTKEKMRFIKALSIIMAYIVLALVLYLFSRVIFPQLYESMRDLIGNYRSYINSAYEWIRNFIYRHEILVGILYSGFFEGMLSDLANNLMGFLGEYSPKALAFIERFANEVKNLFFGVFISIYMLIGKETFNAQIKKLMTAFVSDSTYKKVTSFFHECDYRFGGFIVGKII